MKYKHAFWLSLPFAVLGLGKAVHKFKACHGGENFRQKKQKHIFKFLSWRLGLSAEQQSKLHTLFNQTHDKLGSVSSKREQLHTLLQKKFADNDFDSAELKSVLNKDDFDQAGSTIISAIGEFHSILTPLQREKVSNHLKHHTGCHHRC